MRLGHVVGPVYPISVRRDWHHRIVQSFLASQFASPPLAPGHSRVFDIVIYDLASLVCSFIWVIS